MSTVVDAGLTFTPSTTIIEVATGIDSAASMRLPRRPRSHAIAPDAITPSVMLKALKARNALSRPASPVRASHTGWNDAARKKYVG